MAKKSKGLWLLLLLAIPTASLILLFWKKKLSCSLSLVSKNGLKAVVDVSIKGGKSPYKVVIIWGDGEVTQDTEGGQYEHTYPNVGNANIVVIVTDGENSKCEQNLDVQL